MERMRRFEMRTGRARQKEQVRVTSIILEQPMVDTFTSVRTTYEGWGDYVGNTETCTHHLVFSGIGIRGMRNRGRKECFLRIVGIHTRCSDKKEVDWALERLQRHAGRFKTLAEGLANRYGVKMRVAGTAAELYTMIEGWGKSEMERWNSPWGGWTAKYRWLPKRTASAD